MPTKRSPRANPAQTVGASESSPGFVCVYQEGQIVSTFYVFDIVAVSKARPEDPDDPITGIVFSNDQWIGTTCSPHDIALAMGDAAKLASQFKRAV